MKTIIIQVPIDSVVPNALEFLNILNGKVFEDKNELISFLKPKLKIDAGSHILYWENMEDFCNVINFNDLNTDCYYYVACKIEK